MILHRFIKRCSSDFASMGFRIETQKEFIAIIHSILKRVRLALLQVPKASPILGENMSSLQEETQKTSSKSTYCHSFPSSLECSWRFHRGDLAVDNLITQLDVTNFLLLGNLNDLQATNQDAIVRFVAGYLQVIHPGFRQGNTKLFNQNVRLVCVLLSGKRSRSFPIESLCVWLAFPTLCLTL